MTAESEHDAPRSAGPRHAAVKQSQTPTPSPAPSPAEGQTGKKPRTRILGLDGPRGIACMCVLMVHVGAHYSPDTLAHSGLFLAGQALTFFFALSGFLLYLPFVRSIMKGNKFPDTKSYTIHRLLRVFPAYIVIFLLANFVLRAVFTQNAAVAAVPFTDHGLGMITNPGELIANLTLVHSFIPSLLQTGINPSWSLSMEYCFYIALPALAAWAFHLRNKYPQWNPIMVTMVPPLVLLVVGITGKIAAFLLTGPSGVTSILLLDWGPNWVAVVGRSFWALADNFSFGMVAAILFIAIDDGVIRGKIATKMRWWTFALFIPSSIIALVLTAGGSRFQSTFVALCSGLFVMFIVVPLARGERSKFAEIIDFRPFKYWGTVSLGIYLWHFPVLIMVGRFGWMGPDTLLGLLRNTLIVGAVSVLFASATYKFIEAPAMAYARKLKTR